MTLLRLLMPEKNVFLFLLLKVPDFEIPSFSGEIQKCIFTEHYMPVLQVNINNEAHQTALILH